MLGDLEGLMRVLRFVVIGVLLVGVMRAQVSSPYEKQLERAKQEEQLRIQRQKQLIADSSKLVELSAELKKEIDHPSPTTISADSFKKATEIEKLAHSLRQQLKDSSAPPFYPARL
jgi:acyl carrier protein